MFNQSNGEVVDTYPEKALVEYILSKKETPEVGDEESEPVEMTTEEYITKEQKMDAADVADQNLIDNLEKKIQRRLNGHHIKNIVSAFCEAMETFCNKAYPVFDDDWDKVGPELNEIVMGAIFHIMKQIPHTYADSVSADVYKKLLMFGLSAPLSSLRLNNLFLIIYMIALNAEVTLSFCLRSAPKKQKV